MSVNLNIPLSRTTYYWSVRTVDAQYQISDEYFPEASFLVKRFVNSNQAITDLQQSALAWGDYNNDGYPDLVVSGEDINGKSRTVLFDNINGTLNENRDIILPYVKNGAFSWGDYDNDGDLDLALSGNTGSNMISMIFKNNPTGTFIFDNINSSVIENVDQSSMDWGDYDNDGDLDLALMGVSVTGDFVTKIYRNSDGILSEDSQQNLAGYANGKLKWIDYDNDGDLDLSIVGDNWDYEQGRIYNNNGFGNLTDDASPRLPAVFASDMAWNDIDSDGDLDVVVSGHSLDTDMIELKVLINEPVGTLTENTILSSTLKKVRGGSIVWGDYDNDGDTDLIISGNDENNQPILEAYEYNNNTFTSDIYPVFFGNGVQFSSISLIDVENDGDLDLVTLGAGGINLTSFSTIYDNNEAVVNPNDPPQPPNKLMSQVQGDQVTLSWNRGTDIEDNPTDTLALTYIYRIGTAFGGSEIASGKFEPGFGKTGMTRSVKIRNLLSGLYYWSVKTIDNGFMESEWAIDKDYIIDIIKPIIKSVSVEPKNVGIGRATVKIVIDENFTLDLDKLPTVSFNINGTESIINQVSYDGFTWIGEADILSTISSGTADISVDSVFDSQGNKMDFNQQAGTFNIDTELPNLVSTEPDQGQIGVSISATLKAEFNEDINKDLFVSEKSFRLYYNGARIQGTVDYNSETREATFKPQDKLQGNAEYDARIIGKVSDLVGNIMGTDVTWKFKTAETVLASAGGLIRNKFGDVQLYISPNALSADEEVPIIEFTPVDLDPPDGVTFSGVAYKIGPENRSVTFRKPAVLTIKYNKNELPAGIDDDKLKIIVSGSANPDEFFFDVPLGGTVNAVDGEIVVYTPKLGLFGIFEDTREASFLPKGISNVVFSPRVFSPNGSAQLGLTKPAASGQMNFPNQTGVSFTLGEPAAITITVFSQNGRFVKKLVDSENFNDGGQVVFWDGKDGDGKICSSGIYIVKIEGAGSSVIKTVGILNK